MYINHEDLFQKFIIIFKINIYDNQSEKSSLYHFIKCISHVCFQC